jgi:alkanesulfonate monooxygenase SsuD/methylene tetrahydromethanopterin reductase-like flavin-dependent oxidoreductase (luciferase family)
MIPRPVRPTPVYQPISSPATLEYCARVGHRGVYALQAPAFTKAAWDRYGDLAHAHGRTLRPGEDRCLNLNVYVARTRAQAFAEARDPHDEFCRFLAPYGRFTGYLAADGVSRSPFGFQPTLEDSVGQQAMAIGSVDDVVDAIGRWRELLGLEHLVIFMDMPGVTREQVDTQLHLIAEEVLPQLGIRLPAEA